SFDHKHKKYPHSFPCLFSRGACPRGASMLYFYCMRTPTHFGRSYVIMSNMRGIYTSVTDIRRRVFTEVARLSYEGQNYAQEVSRLPYKIIPGEVNSFRNSIFLECAIVSERIRLAMGLPLRPMDEQAPTNSGMENSVIAQKYYDPPLVNIIKFACN